MARPRPRNSLIALLVALAGLAVAVFVSLQGGGEDQNTTAAVSGTARAPSSVVQSSPVQSTGFPSTPAQPGGVVPQYVWATLAAVDAGGWPPSDAPGTQGGRSFGNHEGKLPAKSSGGAKIRYQEWDVNRKKSGRGRDAERIITGDDGSAWYTADHYETFTRMR